MNQITPDREQLFINFIFFYWELIQIKLYI